MNPRVGAPVVFDKAAKEDLWDVSFERNSLLSGVILPGNAAGTASLFPLAASRVGQFTEAMQLPGPPARGGRTWWRLRSLPAHDAGSAALAPALAVAEVPAAVRNPRASAAGHEDENFRATEMAWLASHLDQLQHEFPGEWIAIDGDSLVAHARDMRALYELAGAVGHPDPFVTAIPATPGGIVSL